MLKTKSELQEGKCIAVAKAGETIKEFEASYSEILKAVFMAVPSNYEIIGYKQ